MNGNDNWKNNDDANESQKLYRNAETSRLINVQTLESKFDDKLKHIKTIKKLYDIKTSEKEIDVDDDEIILHVEI